MAFDTIRVHMCCGTFGDFAPYDFMVKRSGDDGRSHLPEPINDASAIFNDRYPVSGILYPVKRSKHSAPSMGLFPDLRTIDQKRAEFETIVQSAEFHNETLSYPTTRPSFNIFDNHFAVILLCLRKESRALEYRPTVNTTTIRDTNKIKEER
ncbi:hypothetical protein CC78DRAFT_618748 [Lojkania enalia]|uniref:Uncharacterized protein n=1 Tax=Lojkania enalia TaxID=147567 RepID=A0A9P4N264_9PLEO|nr:hypothetical protein CC78DRAFT_618748 [Didymosphaeria enalia]